MRYNYHGESATETGRVGERTNSKPRYQTHMQSKLSPSTHNVKAKHKSKDSTNKLVPYDTREAAENINQKYTRTHKLA